MNHFYHWPLANELYPDNEHRTNRLKRLRVNLRTGMYYFFVQKFSRFVNQQTQLADWLVQHPKFSYPLVHRFLDKRFHVIQRLQVLCDNVDFSQKMTALQLPCLSQQAVLLSEVCEGLELYLNINECQPMEGFWALELRHQNTQELIYLLTFSKVKDALLIGSVQGPNFAGAKETVKRITKQCHGLRPMQLMIEAMKPLTSALGFTQLWGIPQRYQNKSRIVQAKDYSVNYDTIFKENGAKRQHYWQIPLHAEQRDLSKIASNKRSMYRKRYAMLTEMTVNIERKLAFHNELSKKNRLCL